MTIIISKLNHAQPVKTPVSLHPARVPAAAMWEPRAAHPHSSGQVSYGRTVRTFEVGNRPRLSAATVPPVAATVDAQGRGARHLASYVLGAIFGLVVFGGTLLGAEIAQDSPADASYAVVAQH